MKAPTACVRSASTACRGFSLVEVCLAILVVGLGLLAIFGLFPGGLRSSENAEGDSQAALFAETLFGGIGANAYGITNWNTWRFDQAFYMAALGDLLYPVYRTGFGPNYGTLQFPTNSSNYLRYKMDFGKPAPGNQRIRSLTLEVCPGRYGAFTNQETFYTEFFYYGM